MVKFDGTTHKNQWQTKSVALYCRPYPAIWAVGGAISSTQIPQIRSWLGVIARLCDWRNRNVIAERSRCV
jgi:hypothetical protein